MSFQANFFDGKSSKTYKATVIVNSVSWKIIYEDELLGQKEISWKINSIQKSEVFTKGLIVFKYGDTFPFQKIESSDKQFIEYISNSDHKNLNNKIDTWLHKSTFKSILLLLVLIIGFAIGMYSYVIPNVAVSFAKNLPKKYVKDFGNYAFRVLSPDLKIDEIQSQNLQNFVDEMELNNEFPLTVYVAENKQLNAFALSGGKFVIYTGLLEKIETEHQLSALIGHEVSHIENRHILKSVARNVSGSIFMSILLGDVNGAATILGENAHNFMKLSHSRTLEKEADTFGLKIMKNNNLDQHGMAELFEIIKNESSVDVPTFLSTHPMLKDRIDYSKEIANTQKNFQENTILKNKWNIIKTYIFSNKEKDFKNNELDE